MITPYLIMIITYVMRKLIIVFMIITVTKSVMITMIITITTKIVMIEPTLPSIVIAIMNLTKTVEVNITH